MTYSTIPLSDPRCLRLGRYRDPGDVDDTDCCEYCGEPLDDCRMDTSDGLVCDNCRIRKADFFEDDNAD